MTKSIFTLESRDFKDGAAISSIHSAEDANVSPELFWKGEPEKTESLALICDDPDAPTKEPWVHWVVYNIPKSVHRLPEGLDRKPLFEDGMMQGLTNAERIGYDGPCPPMKEEHRYLFKLYALDTKLDAQPGLTKQQLVEAMKGHVLDEVTIIGTFKTERGALLP